MASAFNEQQFEQKLTSLKDTQEAITALSDWCIKNKQHHKRIVNCWLYCFKRVKVDLRLTLFYLANDVIQHSKRKHLDFVESWGTALQKATPLVRDEKVKQRILRIFKIWEERGVYDEAFIADLCGLITVAGKKKTEVPVEESTDFQPGVLLRKIHDVKTLKENADSKLKKISENKLPLTDAESMRLSLKERRHGSDVTAEVDNGVKKMEAYIRCLEAEIDAREKLLCLLSEALVFYEKQRRDAKVVDHAYRNYGLRLKKQQEAVQQRLAASMSPLPSPDVNAPSPSPDSDLEARLKQQKVTNGVKLDSMGFPLANSSFIGSSAILDLSADVFSSESAATPAQTTQNAQQIEVIGNHDSSASFDVNEFFKTLMQQSEPERIVPPLQRPPVFPDWNTPWDQPPPEETVVHHRQNIDVTYDPSMPSHLGYDNNHPASTEYEPSLMHPIPPVAIDVDHRHVAPEIMSGHDIDHRPPLLPNLEVPPPLMNDVPPPLMTRVRPLGPMLAPPPPPPIGIVPDIDQRNLINVTGQHSNSYHGSTENFPNPHSWNAPLHRINEEPPPVKDNVESIDMDFSEDDDESHAKNEVPDRMMMNHPPPMRRVPQTPPMIRPSLAERLRGIQSYTPPKVAQNFEHMPQPDNNGFHEQVEEEHSNWQPRAATPHRGNNRFTRPTRPAFPFRQQSPFRGRPRQFRPRGRW